jgi:hypothetical protein
MFETLISMLINKVLGKYLIGIDKKKLKVSVLKGDI